MPEEHSRSARRRRRLILLGLVVALAAAWYGGKAIVRAHVDGVLQRRVGSALPAFVLRDRAGAEWTPGRLAGRPALLHFFRSRCENCAIEAPEYRQLERELPPEQATILHVMTDAVLGFPAAETAATIAHDAFARPVAIADATFVDAFHTVRWSNVTPVTYVVGRDGAICAALRGRQTAPGLRAALAALE
jgi:peroxiredoxin